MSKRAPGSAAGTGRGYHQGMTDTVSIRDLRVPTVIGVHDWERQTEQVLVFALDMTADVARAAAHDDLADTLDYSAVAATVASVVTAGKFQLIETAAERVAQRLLDGHGLDWVRVEVAKPIMPDGYTAVITIERGRRDGR
jgi:dihydroneopterin aldolase